MRTAHAGRFGTNRVFAWMCDRGWLGQKGGTGFYRYKGSAKPPNRIAELDIPMQLTGNVSGTHSRREQAHRARERLVLLMVNEAAACLGEGSAAGPEIIDLAMVLGTGWAPHRGGPLRYADQRGLADVAHSLDELVKQHGPRFEPCAELRRRAENGEPFYPATEMLVSTGER
jgi:3-hydroxyacyl-CoA dehydrogenase/enoyl-CoA hydratase/3-hydroxybutyryl-CoA epimerase